MSYFGAVLLSAPGLVVIGAVGALTVEHGWGWVLARYHAYRDAAQKGAADIYAELQAQVKDAVDAKMVPIADALADVRDLAGRLAKVEQTVADILKKQAGG
jgi:hypothetical protein